MGVFTLNSTKPQWSLTEKNGNLKTEMNFEKYYKKSTRDKAVEPTQDSVDQNAMHPHYFY